MRFKVHESYFPLSYFLGEGGGGRDNREMHEGCCSEIVKRDRSWENMDRNQLALVCSTLSFSSYD